MEVSEILEIVPVEEYIGQYVDDLEFKGGELWCTSPFNPHERTPSFSIRPEQRIFYDFSSGAGGNLIDFITRYHRVSVYQAVQMLKEYASIKDGDEISSSLMEATRVARRYKKKGKQLPQSTAKILSSDYMNQYEIRKDKLQPWVDEGITWEVLMRHNVRYDALDDRIVYPIKDYSGNIISVCGRTCDPDYKAKGIRKYTYFQQVGTINTLYGFSDNRSEIFDAKEIILFEGAKSCMKAEVWGIKNTGALLTSHLSGNQLHYLIQLASFHNTCIVFALDSDVDIGADSNIKRLSSYARVEWVKNFDDLLEAKDSPVDKGREIFEKLYSSRVRLN